jgi:hypothetical protein
MRTKKAIKQLNKAEALVATVASRYTANTTQLRQLLDSAVAIISQAKYALDDLSTRSAEKPRQSAKKQGEAIASEGSAESPVFRGNKTEFIRALVEARGARGAVPKDIAEAFTARHIGRSENLIYSALSTLVKQKRLKKQDGRYFAMSTKSNAKSIASKKQRITR